MKQDDTTPDEAPKRPRGRPRTVQEQRGMRRLRMRNDEWQTLLELGGAEWVREQVRKAAKRKGWPVPPP